MDGTALPQAEKRQERLHTLFDFALVIKAISGGLEMLGGIFIGLISPMLVVKVAEIVTQGEFARDPEDPVATTLVSWAHSFAVRGHIFIASYLFIRGLIKLVLVVLILRGKQYAYPLFMLSLIIFGSYEAFRGIVRHELLLDALAIFDIVLFLLTLREYKHRADAKRG